MPFYVRIHKCALLLCKIAFDSAFASDIGSTSWSGMCRWSQVQRMSEGRDTLWAAHDLSQGLTIVIKFTTTYDKEVHQTLSDSKLAPQLFSVKQLHGGFYQVGYRLELVMQRRERVMQFSFQFYYIHMYITLRKMYSWEQVIRACVVK